MNQEPIEKLNLDSLTREELIATSKRLRSELLRDRARIGVLQAQIRSLQSNLELTEARLSTAQSVIELYAAKYSEIDEIATATIDSAEAAA